MESQKEFERKLQENKKRRKYEEYLEWWTASKK